MMNLYIRLQNGQPFEHPILEDNFNQAYPDIDVNNLPPEFAKFERITPPAYGAYEVLEGPFYQWNDGIVRDVWTMRPMTEQEKQAKIKLVLENKQFPSWIFNEVKCICEPPIPYPTDGKPYIWDEAVVNWILVNYA